MKRRHLGCMLIAAVVMSTLAGQAWAAGHYELVWFRMWDKSENAGCAGINTLEVWVFDENGDRMCSVDIRDQDGNCLPNQSGDLVCYSTGGPSECKQAQIGLWANNEPYAVKCVDGNGSTSDVTPMMTTQMLPCWGHYSYEAGFIFKADAANPGDADDTLIGDLGQPGDLQGEYTAAYTASMVYASQDPTDYDTSDPWVLDGSTGGGTRHSQTFVATGINRVTTVFGFPVQPANGSTVWRASIQVGGPDGPTICETESPFDLYFGNPLGFDVDECPVTPGDTYTYTMEPLVPSDSNVYTYQGNNYGSGSYYYEGQLLNANWDMFGFVAGWDAGADTVGYIAGKVEDSNNDPLEDAFVTLLDAGGTVTLDTMLTDETGSYAFKNVAPGTYTVRAELAGFDQGLQGGVGVTAGEYSLVNFTLAPFLQQLTNPGFENGDLHAWVPYGDGEPAVLPSPSASIAALSGSYFMGVAGTSGVSGIYQRARVLANEDFELVYNVYRLSGVADCRIGVDPSGGTDPESLSIVWSPWSGSAGSWSTDGDQDKQLDFTSTGTHATVFVECEATGDGNLVAIDNIRLFRSTGPNNSEQTVFDTGWSLVSAPMLMGGAGDPVASVFNQVINAGNSLQDNLHRYDASGQDYESYSGDFSNATQARGYWMNLGLSAAESISASLPSDPHSQALIPGWHLLGQPHRYATPVSALSFLQGVQTSAWRDDVNDGKLKYRSDGGPNDWTWQTQAVTAMEWRVYVNAAQSPDRYPRMRMRSGQEVTIAFDSQNGWWTLSDEMSATSGGVNVPGHGRVLLARPNTWQTVRFLADAGSLTWEVTIDGKMDALHHAEGTIVGGYDPGRDEYAQWGVLSSGIDADFYTDYMFWGQNGEIDNWPADKQYFASYGVAPGVNPGWDEERDSTSAMVRGVTNVNTSSQKSFSEAVAAGWVEGSTVSYDGGYEVVRPASGDDDSIQAWKGYWLKVLQSGLTLKIPGPADAPAAPASDTVSKVRLSLDADGCITSNFLPSLSPTASDGYDTTEDVPAPPAGPADQKEAAMGTSLSSMLILADERLEPAPAGTKVWNTSVQPVNFDVAECKNVTVTWDVSEAGDYTYTLIDQDQSVSTVMTPGADYTFELCDGDALPFDIEATQASPVQVVSFESVKRHGDPVTGDDLAIVLDSAATGNNATREPRRFEATGKEDLDFVVITFDGDISGLHVPGQVQMATSSPFGGTSLAIADEFVAGAGNEMLVLELALTAPVGQEAICARFDISNSVPGVLGDVDCEMRIQYGNAAGAAPGDINTNLIDYAEYKGSNGQTAITDWPFDWNLDGSVNLIDAADVKQRNGMALDCSGF